MFRQRCKFQKRFGLLQVIITCFVFIFTFTSVVISSNPASALVCDRTTNDYTGWRKKEWMDSWFNKQMYIPDNQLTNVPNSESLVAERRSKSSNGSETIMRFQLLPEPDGKMIATLTQRGFKSIQRYKCDKGALQLAEERTAKFQEAQKLAREKSRQQSEAKKLAFKHKVDDGSILPLETLWPHEIECKQLNGSSGLANRLFFKKDAVNLNVDAGLVGLVVPMQTTLTSDKWQALLDERGEAVLIVDYGNSNVKKANYKCNKTSFEVIKLASQYPVLTEAEIAERERKEKEKAEAEAQQLAEAEAKRLAEKKKKEEEAKKAAELASKKKEEEAKKAAELAAKKKEEEAKKAAELAAKKKELELAQKEFSNVRDASIEFVKSAKNIDLLAWSEYLESLPFDGKLLNADALQTFREFRDFAFASAEFNEFYDEFLRKKNEALKKEYDVIFNNAEMLAQDLSEVVVETIGTKGSDRYSSALKSLRIAMEAPKELTSEYNQNFAQQIKKQEAILQAYKREKAINAELKSKIDIIKNKLESLEKNGLPSNYAELIDQTLDDLLTAGKNTLPNVTKMLAEAERVFDEVRGLQNGAPNTSGNQSKTVASTGPEEFSLEKATEIWNEGGRPFNNFVGNWTGKQVVVSGIVVEKQFEGATALIIRLDPNPSALYQNVAADVHWLETQKISLLDPTKIIGSRLTFEGVLTKFMSDRTVKINYAKLK